MDWGLGISAITLVLIVSLNWTRLTRWFVRRHHRRKVFKYYYGILEPLRLNLEDLYWELLEFLPPLFGSRNIQTTSRSETSLDSLVRLRERIVDILILLADIQVHPYSRESGKYLREGYRWLYEASLQISEYKNWNLARSLLTRSVDQAWSARVEMASILREYDLLAKDGKWSDIDNLSKKVVLLTERYKV